MDCEECGFPFPSGDRRALCPKCGWNRKAPPPRGKDRRPVMEVDVAHRGETIEQALDKLERAVDRCLHDRRRGLRVIHGYGSAGGSGLIKRAAMVALDRYARKHGGRVMEEDGNPGATLLMFD